MASGIAHDLNNSLTPIIGYSDFLLDARSGLSEESKRCLECIRAAAAEIADTVEQVRQFYRNRDENEPMQAVDLNAASQQVVDSIMRNWEEIPPRHGLAFKIVADLEPDLPRIPGIERELRQALINLVQNAVEAMPQGGTIAVSTRTTAPEISDNGELKPTVVLELRDPGTGMDENTRQRCIEPFFSTKTQRGCGLGLAMVYGMMRRHDGRIEIESELGHGTTVRLSFRAI
jgi:signal transduction histidine kinase